MVFTTHLFLFYFLPVVLAGYYVLPGRLRATFLTLSSYLFYGWGNPKWIVLLLFSTLVDFGCGLAIAQSRAPGRVGDGADNGSPTRRPARLGQSALVLSIVCNLALLGVFKYYDFFAGTLNGLAGWWGEGPALDLLHLTLPVGISFYTFQSMSYTIDIYRGEAEALRNPVDFACYVALFPQLVAGPIVRYRDVAGQLRRRVHSPAKFAAGAACFSLGFAKKILIANPLGTIADACFEASSVGVGDAWTGLVSYAFQIYFDFSGYSDMAIGLGLMLGFVFPKNFESPYRAVPSGT